MIGYYRRRYGLSLTGDDGAAETHASRAWSLLQRSVYSAPMELRGEQGATASDMAARPALNGGRIPDTIDSPFYNTSDVMQAWAELVRCDLSDDVDGYAYDLVATGRQVISDRFNAVRAAFATAVGAGRPSVGVANTWHCQHFNTSVDAECKGLVGVKKIACQTKVCEALGANFSHYAAHNRDFPGCGTCWCCASGAGPPPPPAPPPANLTVVKRLGTELLQCIDDMDELLGSHHAFLLGSWLHDAEAYAAQASTWVSKFTGVPL